MSDAGAERSLGDADISDAATQSATLWLRTFGYGIAATAMAALAVMLLIGGRWLLAGLSGLACTASVRALVRARRLEARVFATAVDRMLDRRTPGPMPDRPIDTPGP